MSGKKTIDDLNNADFETAIADGITLVDCWAPWCGPCRMQGPILEEVAEAMGDKVKIAKLNIDDAMGVAGQFGIHAIPTLLLFKDGNEVRRFIGVQSEGVLVEAITAVL